MHALYTLAYRRPSSDRYAYPLKDASEFPFYCLWLLWSTRWIYSDGQISSYVSNLCNLMSQAITDPTSNYRPEDAILSVEQFLASSGVIGEAELRVFFKGLAYCDPSIIDDPARLLFLASLTLKLCQQSNVSTLKIFTLFIQAVSFSDRVRLLHILPLLRSLPSKPAPFEDNTAVGELKANLIKEIAPDLDAFIEAFCSILISSDDYIFGIARDEKHNYGIVSILSLLKTLDQPHLAANRIICRLAEKNHLWRGAFEPEYFDEHGEFAYLRSLLDNIHFGTCSGQSHPSTAS
jgi:hypothetical protein